MPPNLYYGNYEHKLDYKGRVGIPRDLLASGSWSRAVIMRASAELPDHEPFPCLYLFDVDRWQKLLETATLRSGMDTNERRLFMHNIVGDAATVDVDASQRVTIPERLLEHATIGRQETARFVGNFTNIEIWNPSVYAAHIEAAEQLAVPVPDLVELSRQVDVQEVPRAEAT